MIGEQISHYRLESKLGSGTYGVVYKGVHVGDEELKVAIKVVQPSLLDDPKFVEALKKECRRLDKLDHPAIVRFRDLILGDDQVAMVLELLEGRDLHEHIDGGPIPLDEAMTIIEKALSGLAYAHSKEVIHRDIKPSNIFLCDDGRVKLLDFGIARAAQATQATQTGTMKGTLDYMAPERFQATGGGSVSDVYAMGLVAWELVAGKTACPDGGLPEKLGWHLGVGAADVRSARPDCPAWLAEAIATLTDKDAAARPASGAAALEMFKKAREERTAESRLGAAEPRAVVAPSTVSLDKDAVAQALSEVREAAGKAAESGVSPSTPPQEPPTQEEEEEQEPATDPGVRDDPPASEVNPPAQSPQISSRLSSLPPPMRRTDAPAPAPASAPAPAKDPVPEDLPPPSAGPVVPSEAAPAGRNLKPVVLGLLAVAGVVGVVGVVAWMLRTPVIEAKTRAQGNFKSDMADQLTQFGPAGPFAVKDLRASSTLAPQGKGGKYRYDVERASDLNLSTAWVEGNSGHGIGESLSFTWERQLGSDASLRCDQLWIYNGFTSKEASWRKNNRAKTLELYVDESHEATLALQDTWNAQVFAVDIDQGAKVALKIGSVYPGSKYDDTVISEVLMYCSAGLASSGETAAKSPIKQ
jgi:serine/threonine protein kinase